MINYVPISESKSLLSCAKRVLVIGCSGGGKTTFSIDLAARKKLEYISNDRDVRWLPNWIERSREEQRTLIQTLILKRDWIFDGASPSSFGQVLPYVDVIIWIRMPRHKAILGVLKRTMRNYGKVRLAMAKGCPEHFPDKSFLSYIWNFEKKYAPIYESNIRKFGSQVPVIVVKSRNDTKELIAQAN